MPVVNAQDFHILEKLPKAQLDSLKGRKVIGCDPGKRSLVYMVDAQGNHLRYTAAQRNSESYSSKNRKILIKEKSKSKIIDVEKELMIQNSKTVSYEKFKDYLLAKRKVNLLTMSFYQRPVWRKMKFRKFSYGKKSVAKFLNQIPRIFGENLVIGYGN